MKSLVISLTLLLLLPSPRLVAQQVNRRMTGKRSSVRLRARDPVVWLAAMKAWRQQERAGSNTMVPNTLKPELQWGQRSFIQPQTHG